MEKITITYDASVFTQAGWRSVEIKAKAIKTSEKMAEVTEVLEIDGEMPIGYASRTGAKRQTYNAKGIAQREIGKKKRLGACLSVV
jgi:isopentenyl diphosphate isomerase/L-lactate dehydrogenase-like FMN-dependent dehydrogenase